MTQLKIISKTNDPIGVDFYREEDSSLPVGFRPTSTQTVRENADKTSYMTTIETVVPIVRTVNGIQTIVGSYKRVTKLNALSQVIDTAAQSKCDALHEAHVERALPAAHLGNLPTVPLTFA